MPYRVVVIGAGFGGIGMAIALKQAGIENFVVVDRADDLGGTWRDNSYPGLTCDVPSHLYSFSFRPWRWSRRFPARDEILAYLHALVAERGLGPHLRFGCGVVAAGFEERRAVWDLTLDDGGTLQATAVVCAVGQLGRPALPDVAGRDGFAGPSWHSARWNHDVDLQGRRVAVVGTGASAIQFVPEIAKIAGHVDVYQRSAPYVLPKADRPYRDAEQALFDRLPVVRKADRLRIFLYGELLTSGFVLSPKLLAGPMQLWRHQLRRQIVDPELRAKCIPDYVMGCKRVVFSNDWYPAMARRDVDLVTDRIERIVRDGMVTADGTARTADVIIYGTGFNAVEFLAPMLVSGLDGWRLQEAWQDGPQAYLGITVSGFPNFFMLYGPNTNLGAIRSSTCSKARSATCSARSRRSRPNASPGLTFAPKCKTHSAPGCNRPAGRRCGRAAATAGTQRPPGATLTTGPTIRSCTGTGSGALTLPRTGSCRNGRPRPAPARHDRPPRSAGAARADRGHAPWGAAARQALPRSGSALAGAAQTAGPAHPGLAAAARYYVRRAGHRRSARRGGVGPGLGFTANGDPLSRRRLLSGLSDYGAVVGGAPELPGRLPGRAARVPPGTRASLSGGT